MLVGLLGSSACSNYAGWSMGEGSDVVAFLDAAWPMTTVILHYVFGRAYVHELDRLLCLRLHLRLITKNAGQAYV